MTNRHTFFQLLATTAALSVAIFGFGRAAEKSISISQETIDDAMSIPLPLNGESAVLGGGRFYGRQAACILFLALVAHENPEATGSDGSLVEDRVVDHIKVTATAGGTPRFTGGHASWFDSQMPLAWAVARKTPTMWNQMTQSEKNHLNLVMEHVLYTAAIFCQPNSARGGQMSSVRVDMLGRGSGSLPNQSAPWHSYLTASCIYWGGVPGMDEILSKYDVKNFKERLNAAGLTHIKAYYEDERIVNLLEGVDQVATLGGAWSVDPLGVRKTIAQFNTSSLTGSTPGQEHPYRRYDPIDTTPQNIVYRWGHEFYAGAQPRSNVGPGSKGECNGTDFGLVDDQGRLRATIPYEFEGTGMPYELNARGNGKKPHTRSSWDYSIVGWNHYAYMYSTVAVLGYFDLVDSDQDRELFRQIRKTTEIVRFIGKKKWRSSAGPKAQIGTWNHGDAFGSFSGNYWAQDLIENIVFRRELP